MWVICGLYYFGQKMLVILFGSKKYPPCIWGRTDFQKMTLKIGPVPLMGKNGFSENR